MIVDVRDYRVVPGTLEHLIERFEAVFLDEQERLGAHILGIFRDADAGDRFLWLRGVPDLPARQRVLTEFYTNGEMWRQHRDEVNTWIADSDDVLLMHPLSAWAPPATGPSTVTMYSHLRARPLEEAEASELQRIVRSAIEAAGGRLLVALETDPAENNFPRHPIRTGEHGLVWFATFASPPPRLPDDVAATVTARRLIPTARSRMR